VRIPFTSKDTNPPATLGWGISLIRLKLSLFEWYSSKVKYDLLTSRINGQTTPSHTVLRFCVDDACFPFFLEAVGVEEDVLVGAIIVILLLH
jgi:hypothetical protein